MINRRRLICSGGEWCSIHDTKAGDLITHIRYPVNPASYPDKRYGDSLSDYSAYLPAPLITGNNYSPRFAVIQLLGRDGNRRIYTLQTANSYFPRFNFGLVVNDRQDQTQFANIQPYASYQTKNGYSTTYYTSGSSSTMQAQSVVDENNQWNGVFQIKDGYFIIDLEKYSLAMLRRLALVSGKTYDPQTYEYTSNSFTWCSAFDVPVALAVDHSNLGGVTYYDLWHQVEVYRV